MSDSGHPAVAQLFPYQHPAAAATLGRAFVTDPLIRAVVAPVNDIDAVRRMAVFFGVVLRDHRGNGQPVLGVLRDGQVAAAAIIEQIVRPPAAIAVVLHDLPLLPGLVRAAGVSGVTRTIALLDTLTRNRPTEPHLYLNVLGVEPAYQGRHYGGALLDYLRDQVALRPDLAGVYLETAKEAHIAYYSKRGYRVLSEIYPLGVRVWRMMQPRTG